MLDRIHVGSCRCRMRRLVRVEYKRLGVQVCQLCELRRVCFVLPAIISTSSAAIITATCAASFAGGTTTDTSAIASARPARTTRATITTASAATTTVFTVRGLVLYQFQRLGLQMRHLPKLRRLHRVFAVAAARAATRRATSSLRTAT